jgi:hypothetical protein
MLIPKESLPSELVFQSNRGLNAFLQDRIRDRAPNMHLDTRRRVGEAYLAILAHFEPPVADTPCEVYSMSDEFGLEADELVGEIRAMFGVEHEQADWRQYHKVKKFWQDDEGRPFGRRIYWNPLAGVQVGDDSAIFAEAKVSRASFESAHTIANEVTVGRWLPYKRNGYLLVPKITVKKQDGSPIVLTYPEADGPLTIHAVERSVDREIAIAREQPELDYV